MRRFSIVLLMLALSVGLVSQTKAVPRPQAGNFKTYEDYVEATTDWKIDQRVESKFGSQIGRYQIFFGPHARADIFLLDTQTGKVWVRTTITDAKGTPDLWLAQDRIDSDEEFAAWSKRQTLPTKQPQPVK
jgi:hypothetical protein